MKNRANDWSLSDCEINQTQCEFMFHVNQNDVYIYTPENEHEIPTLQSLSILLLFQMFIVSMGLFS